MPIVTPSQFWQLKISPNNTKYLLWFFWSWGVWEGRRKNHWLRLKQKKKQFLYFLLRCGNGKYFSSRVRVTYLLNWELMSDVLPTSGFLRIETGSTPGEIIPAWDKISMSGHWGMKWQKREAEKCEGVPHQKLLEIAVTLYSSDRTCQYPKPGVTHIKAHSGWIVPACRNWSPERLNDFSDVAQHIRDKTRTWTPFDIGCLIDGGHERPQLPKVLSFVCTNLTVEAQTRPAREKYLHAILAWGWGCSWGTGLFTTAGRFPRCSGVAEPTISRSCCCVEISYRLLHRINWGSQEGGEALAAGRKELAAKKSKASWGQNCWLDCYEGKKEGRKGKGRK